MTPLQALRQVLAGQSSVTGVVVSVEDGQAVLATPTGRQVMPYVGSLAAGDSVRIANGTAYAIGQPVRRVSV